MNTITIFSGSHKPTASSIVEYKGIFEIAKDFVLRRDLTQLRTSEITLVDKENIIREQDIIVFSYRNKTRFGKVYDIERNYDTTKLSFTYGMDIHQMEIPQNLLPHQFSVNRYFDNRQDIQVEFEKYGVGSRKVTTPDGIISVDVAIRQLVRRDYFAEQYQIVRNVSGEVIRFKVRVTDENVGGYQEPEPTPPLPPINIRLDDPFIQKSYLLKIGSDKMTRLRLYNQDDVNMYVDYQLLNDGSIVVDTTTVTAPWHKEFTYETPINANAVTPQGLFMKNVAFDLYNSLDYAKDLFYQNEYDNEIEIEVSESNDIFKLYTDNMEWSSTYETYDTLLGRPANVYLPNSGLSIPTLVSGYEIQSGVIKIIFGLSRSRLTDIINNFVNKDNV